MTASEYDGAGSAPPARDPAAPAGIRGSRDDGAPGVLPLADAVAAAVAALTRAGIPSPEVDAALLAAHVLDVSRGRVEALVIGGAVIEADRASALRRLTARRCRREPLQHVTGRAPFRSLELEIGPGAFVPRPETELVAQFAIDALRRVPRERPLGVDLGTGSGAIAAAMAVEVPRAEVVAVELSDAALRWAERNRRALGAANLRLVHGDLAVEPAGLEGSVDVVVSNPPYVPDAEIPADPEVRDHDPRAALYGGPDGLDVIRVIAPRAAALVRESGAIVLEHAETQGAAVRAILAEHGWRRATTHPDLTGRDRVTTAVR